ncbi:hypothetical protein ONZ43_g7593 [Nemania bipapillata]|uniref:Uncharacterized protein n=1 Tax=Nemania bipapillata TaxID=110536 RepID=A0ACC2HQE9_9PEZI|nr:hypothetical protein ONZ43_g7593 [Nemania bipapillata]
MTDLSQVLPDFPVAQYARLLPVIERNQLTVTDLLTLEIPEIGKRTQLPLLDVKRLCNAILAALHTDLGVSGADGGDGNGHGDGDGKLKQNQKKNDSQPEKGSVTQESSLRSTAL